MGKDEKIVFQLNHEALRCRFAFESFMLLLERHFASLEDDYKFWFVLQERYVSWLAHMYEFMKLCWAREFEVLPHRLECYLMKEGPIQDRSELPRLIDSLIDDSAIIAVRNANRTSDREAVFSPGFGKLIKQIRNKYYAHPDSERMTLKKIKQFNDEHYFTALSVYKESVLSFAGGDSLSSESKEVLEAFRESLLKIKKER
ncbi:hypothetical protein [Vreelandella janggokensis]|uniref:hypothetical protein n=1 Tax=Vreelandella janggokensis TaxID=370767 RepID=UPI002867A371|nr:hypothetical protein [Halomonas janggokensis]MDR5887567.1 hypothetical protein [Halomonas janggokensis]